MCGVDGVSVVIADAPFERRATKPHRDGANCIGAGQTVGSRRPSVPSNPRLRSRKTASAAARHVQGRAHRVAGRRGQQPGDRLGRFDDVHPRPRDVETDVDDLDGTGPLGPRAEVQAGLPRGERDRAIGAQRPAAHLAGQAVDAGGDVDGDDRPDGLVCGVIKPGYLIADEVLRPAMVAVARS